MNVAKTAKRGFCELMDFAQRPVPRGIKREAAFIRMQHLGFIGDCDVPPTTVSGSTIPSL
jgi:hypothetical protein